MASGVEDAHRDAHVAHSGCRAFDHMEAGLQYCEERFLEVRYRQAACLAVARSRHISTVLLQLKLCLQTGAWLKRHPCQLLQACVLSGCRLRSV